MDLNAKISLRTAEIRGSTVFRQFGRTRPHTLGDQWRRLGHKGGGQVGAEKIMSPKFRFFFFGGGNVFGKVKSFVTA